MADTALIIDGESLSLDILRRFASSPSEVTLSEQARTRMQRSIEVVRDAVRTDRVSYGITTGFGAFANKRISADQVRQLQLNLVRSHACGIGEPLAAPLVRRMLLLKANSLAAGISGVRTELVDALLALLNNDVLPVIPSRGSVGASGDLAKPLRTDAASKALKSAAPPGSNRLRWRRRKVSRSSTERS
jgi:histidine ammonia-lyase